MRHPLIPGIFAITGLMAQSSRPEFEVASIRASAGQQEGQGTVGIRIDGAQIRGSYLTLKDYLGIAYQVKLYQISGPDWLGAQRFDIAATLPAGSTREQLPAMFQALLEDRFQIKLHREKREFPVYSLEVGKNGAKLTPASNVEETRSAAVTVTGSGSAQGVSVNLGRGSSYTFANNRFEAKKLTTAALAANLERFVDRPIVDMTGLEGSYDFAIDVTEEDYRTMLIRSAVTSGVVLPPQALRLMDGATFGSLFSGLEKLGLKLEPRKAPLDLLVIDAARKTPTEN